MSHRKDTEKYRCWINEEDRILSFSFKEGYELKEFKTYKEFQDYYYRKAIF